jgi:hypothetical protein
MNESVAASKTPTFARVKVEKAINAKNERILSELESFFETQRPGYSGIFYADFNQNGIVSPHLDRFVQYLMGKGFNIDALSALEERVLAHEPESLSYDIQVGDLVSTYNRKGEKVKGEIVAKKENGLVCVRYRQYDKNIIIWRNEDEVVPIEDVEIANFSGYNTNESMDIIKSRFDFIKSHMKSFSSKYSVGDKIEFISNGEEVKGTIIEIKREIKGLDKIPVAIVKEDDTNDMYEIYMFVGSDEFFAFKLPEYRKTAANSITNESFAAKSIINSFLSKYSVGDEIEMDYRGRDLVGTIKKINRKLEGEDFIPVATIEDETGEIFELILGVKTKEWFVDKKYMRESASIDSYSDEFSFKYYNRASGFTKKPNFGEMMELYNEEKGKMAFIVKSSKYEGYKLVEIELIDIGDYYDLSLPELEKLRKGGEIEGLKTYILEIDPYTGEMHLDI